jgi:signal transduction histidine kinase
VWTKRSDNTRQIALVFENVLSNAIKYSKASMKPQLEISARELEGRWLIEAHDDGIGFDPKHAERIFGLFKRLHKGNYPGTGLGLTHRLKPVLPLPATF